MPLVLPGSAVLGPRASSAPSTLRQGLAVIGKDSWLARWIATYGLTSLWDGSGGTVADAGPAGCWSPIEQVAFDYKFIQPTSASRPAYTAGGASYDGVPAIYGNGTSWTMYLNSTTALNVDCTILVSCETQPAVGAVWSQNGTEWTVWQQTTTTDPGIFWRTTTANGAKIVRVQTADPTNVDFKTIRKYAISSGPETLRYNNPLRLLSWTGSQFGTARIREIAIVPKLTVSECEQMLPFLA